jgi:hypothetical protein
MPKDMQQSDNKSEPELPFDVGHSDDDVSVDVTKKELINSAENPVGSERENI